MGATAIAAAERANETAKGTPFRPNPARKPGRERSGSLERTGMPCHNSPPGSEPTCLCSSGCSPVLADQVLDDVGALDAGGHIGRLAGFAQRRSLFPRLMQGSPARHYQASDRGPGGSVGPQSCR
jgi:hypothetical protein